MRDLKKMLPRRKPSRSGAASFAVALVATALFGVADAQAAAGPIAEGGVDWTAWKAGNEIDSLASLQRGARNYMNYCSACHSIKYKRYSRLAEDLRIPDEDLEKYLILPGDKKSDYIITALSPADGEAWFGKAPPDLSLIVRSRGADYVFQFMKTFYSDPKTASGVNNLALPGTAMPHVLSELQGVQKATFQTIEQKGADGSVSTQQAFLKFEPGLPGSLSEAEYDEFIRDTVNFLDYVGEPAQLVRRSVGVWVILFLLAFTGIAYLLKQEYWKDVK
jgi:ubiquinol-cytochrome c reductase cytochrome c1 subunit